MTMVTATSLITVCEESKIPVMVCECVCARVCVCACAKVTSTGEGSETGSLESLFKQVEMRSVETKFVTGTPICKCVTRSLTHSLTPV